VTSRGSTPRHVISELEHIASNKLHQEKNMIPLMIEIADKLCMITNTGDLRVLSTFAMTTIKPLVANIKKTAM
jgi:hypothetical protein